MRAATVFLAFAPFLFAAGETTPGTTDGTEVDTKIDRVTVYSDRARIMRAGTVSVKDGRQRILVSGLPHSIDADSVSASLPGKHGARILSIEVEDAFGKRVDKKEAQALIDRAEELTRSQRAIDDELSALSREEAYLRSFQVKPRTDEKGRPLPVTLEPSAWGQTLSFVSESLASTLARTRAKQKERQELQERIQAFDVELQKVRSYERVAVKRVALEVEGSKVESVPLEVTYAIAGPTWRPAYDVRVLSTAGKVEIVTHGVVRQATGEDWTNVTLTLSTAFPEGGADIPELLAWRLGDQDQYAHAAGQGTVAGNMGPGQAETAVAIREKRPQPPRQAASAPAPPPAPAKSSARASRDDAPAMEQAYLADALESDHAGHAYGGLATSGPAGRSAGGAAKPVTQATPRPTPPPAQIKQMGPGLWSLPAGRTFTFVNRDADGFAWSGDQVYCPSPKRSAGGFDYTFSAQGRRTVGSDGKERKVKLASATFPTSLVYEVVAPLSTKAFLRTNVKNDTRAPFLAGEAFVFLDEDFVGRSFFSTIAPSAHLDLSLGIDEDIKVERRVEQVAETTGLIGKKDRTVFTVHLSVKSYKRRAVEVLLRDQIPVTWQKDDISIEKLSVRPDPVSDKSEETRAGLYAWRLALPAGGKEDLRLKYAVEHPRDFDIVEQRSR